MARYGTIFLFVVFLLLALSGQVLAAQSADVPPKGGHPLAETLVGSKILAHSFSPHEVYSVPLGEVVLADDGKHVFTHAEKAEGAVTRITYVAPHDVTPENVLASYREFFRRKGFETLYAALDADFGPYDVLARALGFDQVFWSNRKVRRLLVGKLERPEGPVFLVMYAVRNDTWGPDLKVGGAEEAQRGRTYYRVDLVEARPREGGFMVMKSCDIVQSLNQKGKAAIYALRFFPGTAALRGESAPALKEIAQLLEQDKALRLLVVGHVHGQEEFHEGVTLSKKRAETVVSALVNEYHIAPDRLEAHGVGMLAPLVTNENEEGRSRNERIELVKR